MDGVDAVLVDISTQGITTLAAASVEYPPQLLSNLHALCTVSSNEINAMGSADRQVAMIYAEVVNKLLCQQGLSAQQIVAIGSHGQTIRHYPDAVPELDEQPGFTLQIGDPTTLAVNTGIDVIADFRRKDIALGGQGAPLAPAFHHTAFSSANENRAIVNIGGLANISYLPATSGTQAVIGFDTGPGNTLMDAWCRRHLHTAYDDNGQWAAKGKVNEALLAKALLDPYFSLPAPKSTGREYFNAQWLDNLLMSLPQISAADVQASLLQITSQSIANAVNSLPQLTACFICGGGAFNPQLMNALTQAMPKVNVSSTQELGIHPQWVEGAAFAWLAYAHKHNIVGNIPAVTGASRGCVLGNLTPWC
jgi:anhydro-N-acetylmuramic acid kinase